MTIPTAATSNAPALHCPKCSHKWNYPAQEFTGREVATKFIYCPKCHYGEILWGFARTALHPPITATPKRKDQKQTE